MTANYYAILGVAPTSEDVVIRAAYVALMRRYHPDSNDSPAAVERAKAITRAYAVLGDPQQRSDYDRRLRNGDDAYDHPAHAEDHAPPSWLSRVPLERIAMLAAVLLLLLLPLYLIRNPLTVQPPPRLAGAEQSRRGPALSSDPAATCVSRAAHDLIKQQLVRRAGNFHRGDRAMFAQILGDSFVRIDSTLAAVEDDASGTVVCEANVVVGLPPGVALGDGRRSLAGQLEYSLASGDGEGQATSLIANPDRLARELATLTRLPRMPEVTDPAAAFPEDVAIPPPARPVFAPTAPVVRPPPMVAAPAPAPRTPVAATRPPARAPSRPAEPAIDASFNCKFAKGRGETAVCGNRNLATLDRQLAVFYGQSWGQSDATRRAALLKGRERFIVRRDQCQSESCTMNAYLGQMRDIAELMAKPSGPR